jgi:hypothetical protein
VPALKYESKPIRVIFVACCELIYVFTPYYVWSVAIYLCIIFSINPSILRFLFATQGTYQLNSVSPLCLPLISLFTY